MNLSPCSSELHDNDIQAIRDFAIGLPWEWRRAIEALCNVAANRDVVDDLEDAKTQIEDLQEAIKDAVEEIRGVLFGVDLEQVREEIEELLSELLIESKS